VNAGSCCILSASCQRDLPQSRQLTATFVRAASVYFELPCGRHQPPALCVGNRVTSIQRDRHCSRHRLRGVFPYQQGAALKLQCRRNLMDFPHNPATTPVNVPGQARLMAWRRKHGQFWRGHQRWRLVDGPPCCTFATLHKFRQGVPLFIFSTSHSRHALCLNTNCPNEGGRNGAIDANYRRDR
jgi:hypothetical protein